MPGLFDILNGLGGTDPNGSGLLSALLRGFGGDAGSVSGGTPSPLQAGPATPGAPTSALSSFAPQPKSLLAGNPGDATLSPLRSMLAGQPSAMSSPQPGFAPQPQGFPPAGPSAPLPTLAATPVGAGAFGALLRGAGPAASPGDDDDADKPAATAVPLSGSAPVPAVAPSPTSTGVATGLAQGAAVAKDDGFLSGLGDRIGNIYGNGGKFDGLIALGVGMNSGPGGTARALASLSQQQEQRRQNDIQQSELSMRMQQLAQTQAGQTALVPIVRQKVLTSTGKDPGDAGALAIIGNPGALSSFASQITKSPEEQKAEKAQLVDVPQPDGSTQKQWIVPGQAGGTVVGAPAPQKPPEAARDVQYAMANWQGLGLPDPAKNPQYWSDLASKRIGGPGGVSVTMPPVEKASEAAYGKAEGDHFGAILKAGDDARTTQGQLQFMNDAFQQGGDNITTGPAAKAVLASKQFIQGITGIDLGGIPESEAVQKLGFGLATSLVRDINPRGGTQMEFLKGLQNVPGAFMSPAGSRVMMSILNQRAQQQIDLGQMVQDPANRRNWSKAQGDYFDAHPLISPFTGKPLNRADLDQLRVEAQRAGFDPATGARIGAGGAAPSPAPSAAPSWSIIGN